MEIDVLVVSTSILGKQLNVGGKRAIIISNKLNEIVQNPTSK